MDYEKKYNEALERAKDWMSGNIRKEDIADSLDLCKHIFPELSESEDERMLRTIIRGFENWKGNGNLTFNNIKVDDILAYLEKQKEPQPGDEDRYMEGYMNGMNDALKGAEPAEWSEEDKTMLERCISKMANIIPVPGKHGLTDMSFEKHTDEELAAWLKSLPKRLNLQPKPEWSEEDKNY